MYDTQNAVSKQFWTKKLDLHNSSITLNVLYSCQVAQVTNNKKGVLTQSDQIRSDQLLSRVRLFATP